MILFCIFYIEFFYIKVKLPIYNSLPNEMKCGNEEENARILENQNSWTMERRGVCIMEEYVW